MKLPYELIALDLDGTLTNSQKNVTPRTKDVLRRAQQAGARLVLASGRALGGLLDIAEELEMQRYGGILMPFNGGLAVNAQTGETLWEETLDRTLALEVLRHLQKYRVTPMTYHGRDLLCEASGADMTAYEAKLCHLNRCVVDNLPQALTFSPIKILVSAEPAYLDSVLAEISAPFAGRVDMYKSAPFYLETAPLGVNKGSGLERLCALLGVNQDKLIAFGDEENDLEMLEYAGCGVAMENANKIVKDQADVIAPNNNADGVAHILEQHF